MNIQISSKHQLKRSGTTQLRCVQPADYFRALGADVALNHLYMSTPKPGDVLLLHRAELDKFTNCYINLARKLGLTLVYDTDDLLFSDLSIEYFKRNKRDRLAAKVDLYKAAMSLCDVILVSTDNLATHARKFHTDVRVLRNSLSSDYLDSAKSVYKSKNRKEGDPVTMAYMSGSSTHDYDFKLMENALLRLLADYSNVHLKLVGPVNFSSEFHSFGQRFKHSGFVEYKNFPKLYEDVDINLVPLEVEQEVCQSKSELKFIEAGACGVLSVASPTDVYLEVVRDKVNGMIVRENDWYRPLQYLIEHPGKIPELGDMAHEHTLEFYASDVRAGEYQAEFEDILKKYGPICKKNYDKSGIYKDKLTLDAARLGHYYRKKIRK